MAIWFNSEVNKFYIQNVRDVKQWIRATIKEHGFTTGFIDYIFVTDDRLYEINKKYLNHTTFTDIITFDYSEGKTVSADIFISVERVMENADNFNDSFNNELKRVLIHGILHLLGYKDDSREQKAVMRATENKYLDKVKYLLIIKNK